jgi:hypothetical protein
LFVLFAFVCLLSFCFCLFVFVSFFVDILVTMN